MPEFFETHAHYDLPQFDNDRDEVLSRCRQMGVTRFLCPGISYAGNARMLSVLGDRDDFVFAVGIHPKRICPADVANPRISTMPSAKQCRGVLERHIQAIDELSARISSLENMARADRRIVAIGETGLDYSLDPNPIERKFQAMAFRMQIELSLRLRLPLVLHVRDAHEDAMEVIRFYYGAPSGVAHCFSFGPDEARDYLEAGLFLGIGGMVTRRDCPQVRDAVTATPLDRIVLETDAPYVLPEGRDGGRNTSESIPLIAEEVARLKGVGVDEVAEVTTRNAERLFLS